MAVRFFTDFFYWCKILIFCPWNVQNSVDFSYPEVKVYFTALLESLNVFVKGEKTKVVIILCLFQQGYISIKVFVFVLIGSAWGTSNEYPQNIFLISTNMMIFFHRILIKYLVWCSLEASCTIEYLQRNIFIQQINFWPSKTTAYLDPCIPWVTAY